MKLITQIIAVATIATLVVPAFAQTSTMKPMMKKPMMAKKATKMAMHNHKMIMNNRMMIKKNTKMMHKSAMMHKGMMMHKPMMMHKGTMKPMAKPMTKTTM
jgi:hypothetical protein